MPGKIKVKVLAGRNLPVMDRASDTTDAFVEIKFGGVTHKTDVCRKSLNPHWNSTEWYRFEVEESELQDEPLQLRLMDHDTYSANDAIGKVVISLAPLLAREANNVKGTGTPGGAVLSGWIPVFDTMHGIRGELNVIVKVELLSDFNKYKTSSCGVQFFHCPMIPPGYRATSIHGFVEELVVNDDPEYQWIDKIRTPRASNEARQVAFIKLSNQVQRLVGLKAAELGANAVVGYQQDFDLEGEAGVVARAIGTAVSITPLPTPSQPINITCTPQQLKKCLDILATDDESVTDLSQYYSTHQEELQKMLSILNPKAPSMLDEPEAADDDDDKLDRGRAASINSYAGSVSIYQEEDISHKSLRHLSEDQTDLNKLLNKNDDEDSDSSGPIQKIKKMKKNFFTRKFSRRKSDKQDDTVSIKSNSSETSRISLVDIKNEFKKLKKLKTPKFRKVYANKQDEGVGMASILARSVIHVHTSLACIAETQDSEHSPSSTMRRTSESEPTINKSDEDSPTDANNESETKNESNTKKVPEIHFTSLKNISSEKDEDAAPERRISESCPTSPMAGRSENLLKLPGDKGYFGSVSSALSGDSSIYSSSEEEDYESSDKSEMEEILETTTSVVKSVLNHEVNPAIVAQMDKKLSILENTPPDLEEIKQAGLETEVETKNKESDEKSVTNIDPPTMPVITTPIEIETKTVKVEENVENPISNDASISASPETCVSKPNSHYIKIHNPFAHKKAAKSISAPSSPTEKRSFVGRSSKRIRDQLTKLSKSNMIKSISHYSLLPKKKHEKSSSQTGSSSNVPSRVPSETVLGSHFLSYSDLLSLDKEGLNGNKLCKSDEFDRSKVSMYIGSEPVSRASLSGPSFLHSRDEHDHFYHKRERPALKPTGLIHTAMETILIDKVDTLLLPASPEPCINTQFFNDVSDKLVEHKNREFDSKMKMGQVQTSTGSTTPRIVAVTPKRLSDDYTTMHDVVDRKFEVPDSPEHVLTGNNNHDKHKNKLPKIDIHIKSTFIDKVHSILPKTPDIHFDHVFHRKHSKSDVKSGGLVHTAMQTILMDRAQSMIPDTPEPIPIKTEPFERKTDKPRETDGINSKGLIHTAMQTMLIDKVQSVLPDTPEPIPINLDSTDNVSEKSHTSHESHMKPSGLIHTAMQTMLMDNLQSVLPDSPQPVPINLDSTDNVSEKSHTSHESHMKPSGLIHTAMQTMLMDNLQSVLPDSSEPVPINLDSTDNVSEKSHASHASHIKPTGLIHTAMQTMLMDNLQSVLPDSSEPVPIKLDSTDNVSEKSHTSHESHMKPSGLIHSAMETILIDKVQNLLGSETEVTPEKPETENENVSESNMKSSSLIHTTMETMLLDRAQALINPYTLNTQDTIIENKTDNVDRKENDQTKEESESLVRTAMETMLIDRVRTLFPNENVDHPENNNNQHSAPINSFAGANEVKSQGLINTEMETILIDKAKALIGNSDDPIETKKPEKDDEKTHDKSGLIGTAANTIQMDKVQPVLATSKTNNESNEALSKNNGIKPKENVIGKGLLKADSKTKKLIRQDSIHSDADSHKMSNENLPNNAPSNVTRAPVLQSHTISSQLETIPSVTESSERSLDSESFETNSVSVCDNSHAACDFDRDRDRGADKDRGSPKHARHESYGGKEPVGSAQAQNSSLNSTSTPMGIHRRSSDSDLSVTPKGGSLNTSAGNVGSGGGAILKPSMNSNNLDLLEYPFLTMKEYPPGFIVHIGGTVMSRAVRVCEGAGCAGGAAWPELRTELRAHARALRCNAVLAYSENVAICDDVCVLSASGTAAVINLDCDFNADIDQSVSVNSKPVEDDQEACSIAHVPYSPGTGPYRAELSTCGGCRRVRVPAVLLATCEKPSKLAAYSKAVTLTAVAGRVRRSAGGAEAGARELSDQLPFLEYELHKLLLAKLRMQGANAIFSLKTQIAVGDRCVLALASGLACKLTALPPPTPPKIKASENDKEALEIQRALWDTFVANKAANGYDVVLPELNPVQYSAGAEPPVLDLAGDKDACVLELDEAEDVETARLLCVRRAALTAWTPSQRAQKQPPLAFVQVSRGRLTLSTSGGSAAAERSVSRALDAVAYKLRRVAPVAVHTDIRLDLPEDEIQVVLSGTAIPLMDPSKPEILTESTQTSGTSHGAGDADDDIFELDEEQLVKKNQVVPEVVEKETVNGQVSACSVCVTCLPTAAFARRAARVCALRLLFVRETTAVRELGGLSGFLHTFTCEVMAIVRAYTAALGGNALTSYYITQLMLQDNAHKNQGQCLLSVGGDVVHVTY